jgi:pSer/pThr/pTyr-binding forkhead associated (FHA) protein
VKASIIIVAGKGEGDYYPLGEEVVTLGRDEHCAIQILDEQVSRRHLQIALNPKDKTYHAQDLKSANGVFINDRRITDSTSLADGDIIALGNSKVMFAARHFPDRKSAWDYYKLCGERGRSTIVSDCGSRRR